MMKHLLILALSIFFTVYLQGQVQSEKPINFYLNSESNDFETIRKASEDYFIGKDKGRGSGYKQWKRWEELNKTRLNGNGKLVNRAHLLSETYKVEKQKQVNLQQSNTLNAQGDWKPWSATKYTNSGSWSPGIGRVSTVAYHPTDANTIYIGTPAGGLFRTTDNGNSWTGLTNNLSSIGVSGIAIHPTSPNIIYILTGDGDGRNTRSIGVFKSTDSGMTWETTGLTWGINQNIYGFKLVMEPNDPSYILVASSIGIFRTTNSGDSWNNVQIGSFIDIEYRPNGSNPHNILYASTRSNIWKSINFGSTWTNKFQMNAGTDRLQITVTKDDPNYVYFIAGPYADVINGNDTIPGFRGVFKSTDAAESFNLVRNTPNILGGNKFGNSNNSQSWYDLAILADPDDKDNIHIGGVNIWNSENGGQSFSLNTYWVIDDTTVSYVHADIHHLSYNPLNGFMYVGCDGGIFYSADGGETYTDITAGLDISQINHFAGTDLNPDLMLGGMQDNGTATFMKNIMKVELGADGADCLIHPSNSNIMYAQTQFGDLRKTTDGGENWSNIKPPSANNSPGPFITRWDMDPNNPNVIRVGWANDTICSTFDGGDTWFFNTIDTVQSNNGIIRDIHVTSNGNIIYVARGRNVYRSDNGGGSWVSVYQHPNQFITSVSSLPSDPLIGYFTAGGFDNSPKFISNPMGTYVSVSPGLPDVPANISGFGDGQLYVGTDIGVYVLTGTAWQMFRKNLPNTIVTDFEFYENLGYMRIATFGRGIWQSDLYNTCSYNLALTQANDPDNNTPSSQSYEAADVITSSRLIQGSNGDVIYKAGDLILLQNGFRATSGNKVIIGIKPCGIELPDN